MAEDPKTQPASDKPAGDAAKTGDSPATNVSPAPADVAGTPNEAKDKGGGGPPPAGTVKGPPADALSDGTVPTVLTPGSSHVSVPKGKASLTGVYRKADVMTTLITFAGALVAAGIIFGVYLYLNRNTGKPVASPGKISTLSSSDLSKLGSFFNGNSAGNSSQILTINSSTLFKNPTAVDSDLKVTGGVSVTGTTSLGNLNVDQTSTLGVVNTRGQLTVSGPLTVQSDSLFNGGASFKGNLTATGNASFGGSLSAGTITVGTLSVSQLNINGHFNFGGSQPSASGGTIGADSNDSAGSVSNVTGSAPGNLVTITFHSPYPLVPTVIITPVGANSAKALPYVLNPSATGFTIGAADSSTGPFNFNYWVIQ